MLKWGGELMAISIRKVGLLLALAISLSACYPPQPHQTQNICEIFAQYPSWYWDAKQTQDKWGVPVAVQMAIMYQESGFQATAEPMIKVKNRFQKITSWKRESTALGYCQALVHTWQCYEKSTGRDVSRDEFAAASDFIGWYANTAKQIAKIQPTDAYDLYLAYHEGLGGYHSHSFWRKPWLIVIAHKVEAHALTYAQQLSTCESSIPKPPEVNTIPIINQLTNPTPAQPPSSSTPPSPSPS